MQRAILGLFVAALLGIVCRALRSAEHNKVVSIGKQAPAWKGLEGTDGKKHGLDELKDAKAVVIAFTSNHCPIASAYEERFLKFAKQYQDKGVAFIAISVSKLPEDTLDEMKKRAKEKAYSFQYLHDPSQKTGRVYGATVTPHLFVLDRERKIAYMGAFDDSEEDPKKHYVKEAVEALLAGKKPPVEESRQYGCTIEYDEQTAVAAGCSPEDASTPATPEAITIAVGGKKEYEGFLARHRGKVVLVDFWATWCGPCRKEFPRTVALARRHGAQGLVAMSVSLDKPADREKALAFLRAEGAAFDNLLSSAGAGEESFTAFDLEGGSIPQYKLYDRKGTLRQTFFHDPTAGKKFTHEDIERKALELLTEK